MSLCNKNLDLSKQRISKGKQNWEIVDAKFSLKDVFTLEYLACQSHQSIKIESDKTKKNLGQCNKRHKESSNDLKPAKQDIDGCYPL